nr:(Fe-S)-binding protein [Desulfuromonadales bacterium]NIR33851.1 (Fe-S)-binding protein [Desulfuromonadales bacterium]NIS40002.1 (Fe-S)-binding protein [Desulfuromonadales bacterium]
VGFFLGCVMSLMYAEVSKQTVRALAHQGFEVHTPKDQKCCGAPHLTEGDPHTARDLGTHNLDLFLDLDVDYIVTDCAGCGAVLKEYEELLEARAEHGRLQAFRDKVRDITEFLAEVGIRTEGLVPVEKSVTYHESCHLVHAQQVSKAPRQVLAAIPGIELREMKESSWCCGSAATFGLKYTEESRQILDRKMGHVAATGAEILVSANPGCHLQLDWGVREGGMRQKVMHIMELFGQAVPD